jgi:hypothetical protein
VPSLFSINIYSFLFSRCNARIFLLVVIKCEYRGQVALAPLSDVVMVVMVLRSFIEGNKLGWVERELQPTCNRPGQQYVTLLACMHASIYTVQTTIPTVPFFLEYAKGLRIFCIKIEK